MNDAEEQPERLYHFGVKGMQWGVRRTKQELDAANPRYSDNMRKKDKRTFGNEKAVARINRRMNKGQKHTKAVLNEKRLNIAKAVGVGAAVVGARVGISLMATYGPGLMSDMSKNIKMKAAANRGRTVAEGILGKPNTKMPKRSRGGVYNITTM